ncbi:Maf family protein [Vibrio viridaestus]|uniref:7-methyl-GTP pyrophosphatase n=1 Tax=Vibrio viridaestus TaxID=2487322 RepID=A0A3N9TJG0_9VIBR|nr:nucleoside triphosphate pyrophosphatase [Vibrio viridaestus]RQW64449.1 septum formation inhibitor Maf [Vibrio viridaestus]
MKNPQLVLASTSPFRREILEKLSIAFITEAPNCDETPLANESPLALVERLAITKAKSCHSDTPSLIIGSDQVCVVDSKIIGKPHSRDKAIEQLNAQNGRSITFLTGLALYNSVTGNIQSSVESYTVHFRLLSAQQIEAYVDKEQPFSCAGSFKSEGLGVSLFKRMEGDDPNTLIGLPLIKLIDFLANEGIQVLS